MERPRLEKTTPVFRRDFSRCPRCGAPTVVPVSFAGTPSEFWRECIECNTFINTYIPQPHQAAVHIDPHTYIGNFGAYGTGKTTTSREEVFKHAMITPNANILIGANVQSQYEQTIKRELESDLPQAFVANSSVQKQYIDLINGARIMYRPFDDAGKLLSYNLSMFVIVEASETSAQIYATLKTRLRNPAASVRETDELGNLLLEIDRHGVEHPVIRSEWRRGISESNPDSGWIRTDVLMTSDEIHKHGSVADVPTIQEAAKDPATSTHIASTDVNVYLPKTFIQELIANKPKWWIARYVYGSFAYAEGLVYPSAMEHVIPTFQVPKHWRRMVAFDYGLSDDAVYILVAVDPISGVAFTYRESRNNNMNVKQLARTYFEVTEDIPSGGMICQPLIDPKSGAKRDYDKQKLSDLFLEEGISFKPGYINVDARIFRLNTYFESGRLKIMDCCHGLIDELREYKFKQRSLDKPNEAVKPEDKANHGINALEWIVMELPADPRNILHGAYGGNGEDLTTVYQRQGYLPNALMDDAPVYTHDAAYGAALF